MDNSYALTTLTVTHYIKYILKAHKNKAIAHAAIFMMLSGTHFSHVS